MKRKIKWRKLKRQTHDFAIVMLTLLAIICGIPAFLTILETMFAPFVVFIASATWIAFFFRANYMIESWDEEC